MVLQFSLLNDSYFPVIMFYQMYHFCLKIVFNSLEFQKNKKYFQVFSFYNSNAYEHLKIRAFRYVWEIRQKKYFQCFQAETMYYVWINQVEQVFIFQVRAQFTSRNVIYTCGRYFSKKDNKIPKVSVRKSFWQSCHWVSVLFWCYDTDFEHVKKRKHKSERND